MVPSQSPHLFEQLDFAYWPSRDVAADVAYFEGVLGARVFFAIEGMGTRVAMLELTESPPRILLAGHLESEAPILVYRVTRLTAATADLERRGWERGTTLEIPHGPVCSFRAPGAGRRAPGGQRARDLRVGAPLELARLFMDDQLAGRDF
jgi:hypothetical protein